MHRRRQARSAAHTVLLVCAACLWLCSLGGCASQVRYTRPSGAVVGPGVYRVPRNWDYRTDYRVPPSRLVSIIDSYLGVRYRYGGTSRKGLDCSGLVYVVFRELNHARMPRTTRRLKRLGKVVPRSDAAPGDLVFFAMKRAGAVDHVGIYVGKGRFAHASSTRGVRYDRLGDEYYRRRVVCVRRVF